MKLRRHRQCAPAAAPTLPRDRRSACQAAAMQCFHEFSRNYRWSSFHFPTGKQRACHRLLKVFGAASGWVGWRKTLLNSQVLFQTMSGEETFLECNFAFVRPRKTFSTIAIAIARLSKLYPLWRNDAIFAWLLLFGLNTSTVGFSTYIHLFILFLERQSNFFIRYFVSLFKPSSLRMSKL